MSRSRNTVTYLNNDKQYISGVNERFVGRIRDITQIVLTLYDSILRHERCLAVELTTANPFSIRIHRTIESRQLPQR